MPILQNASPDQKRLAASAFYAFAVLLVAWALWGAYTYAGPYRWAAELQLWAFGHYGEKLTFVLMALMVMVPVLAVGALLGPRFFAAAADPRRPTLTPAQSDRRTARAFALLAAVLAVVGAGLIAYMAVPHDPPSRAAIDLLAREMAAPGTDTVGITAMLQPRYSATLVTTRGSSTKRDRYTPLTRVGWRLGDPVMYVLAETEASSRFPITRLANSVVKIETATLARNDLPGLLREDYRKDGLVLADPYWVAYPTSLQEAADWPLKIIIGCFIGAAICVILAAVSWRAARKQA